MFRHISAFYVNNQVTFGDCDCETWSPLVALDVIAHEIGHGYTEKSSNLEYSGQSGGLNEGYSDILGTLLEFHVNDSQDTPDFLIGEMFVSFASYFASIVMFLDSQPFFVLCGSMEGSRGVLRYMEDPPLDGRGSIGSVRPSHFYRYMSCCPFYSFVFSVFLSVAL